MQQGFHEVLPLPNHDESARQDFNVTFRRQVGDMTGTGGALVYDKRVAPAYKRVHGHAPATRHEARRALDEDPYWQAASALKLTQQEMLWECVGESIERQYDGMHANAQRLAKRRRYATLRLDPAVQVPRYLNAVDIHIMPGNYDTELCAGDIYPGALYDRGVFLRVMGRRGAFNEDFGVRIAPYLRKRFPSLRPERILDQGCAVGGTTLGLSQSFPEAEIHAIDVAAPMLRYAHARAESLQRRVHFSQQNAEKTDFPDNHFDFIFSFALLHETSTKACSAVIKEARRILAPGGVLLYLDLPQWDTVPLFKAAEADWDTLNNAEPFIGKLGDLDRRDLMIKAGFADRDVVFESAEGIPYPLFGGVKR